MKRLYSTSSALVVAVSVAGLLGLAPCPVAAQVPQAHQLLEAANLTPESNRPAADTNSEIARLAAENDQLRQQLARQQTNDAVSVELRSIRATLSEVLAAVRESDELTDDDFASGNSFSEFAPMAESPFQPWVILGIGLLVGFLIGSTLARRQERLRRGRVRL